MPKQSSAVISTEKEISAARCSGTDRTEFRIRGAPGLVMRVSSTGSKSWFYLYKSPATGKRAKTSLGRYPEIGLKEAKGLAVDQASAVRGGADPLYDRRQEELSETFAELAQRYMREHADRNARNGELSTSTHENKRQLAADLLPLIGRIKADGVTRQHVRQVVEKIADRGSYVAADRALGLVRAIYNWACGTGRLERNPTIGLKKRNTSRPKARVLTPAEIRTFCQTIDPCDGITPALRDAYYLQLLTGARIGEVLGTARDELELERGVWTIPAIRTKAARKHVLPLSPRAVEIWSGAIARADEGDRMAAEQIGKPSTSAAWVFPSPRTDAPITPHAGTTGMLRLRERLTSAGINTPFNTHDLRRTVATQLGEMEVPDEVIERILNHAPRTVAGKHYNHARYQGPMRQALEAWAKRFEAIIDDRESQAYVVAPSFLGDAA